MQYLEAIFSPAIILWTFLNATYQEVVIGDGYRLNDTDERKSPKLRAIRRREFRERYRRKVG